MICLHIKIIKLCMVLLEMIEPLSYPINKKNMQIIIDNSAHDAKGPITKFFNTIKYVPHKRFKQLLQKKLSEVIQIRNKIAPNRPIFVYIDTNRYQDYLYKSNYWIYTYLEQFAKNRNVYIQSVFTLDDAKIIVNDIVLLIDDCIYSGDQMSSAIESMNNTYKKNVNMVLFVPFMSAKGLQSIKIAFKRNSVLRNCQFIISDYEEIKPLKDLGFSMQDGISLFKYYSTSDHNIDVQAHNELEKYNIYFDHKVGDYMSSFPAIFSGLVPNENNQIYIRALWQIKYNYYDTDKESLLKKFNRSLEFYPLLTNCNHLLQPDFNVSSCPKPPYKDDYQQFLQITKGIPKQYSSFRIPNTPVQPKRSSSFTDPKTTAGKPKTITKSKNNKPRVYKQK